MAKISETTTVDGLPSAVITQTTETVAIQAAIQDTAARVNTLVASTPGVAWQTIAGMLVRWGIGVWGAHYATVAETVTGETYQKVVGIVAVLLVLLWSWLQKKWQAWRENETAKASSGASAKATQIAGAPVAVPVQPASSVANI